MGRIESLPAELHGAWRAGPARGHLLDGEVHLWRTSLDRDGAQMRHLIGLLSADEQHRAQRYRFATDRHRFIVRRAMLRRILACYLRVEPIRVQLRAGEYGRLFVLPVASSGSDLDFNVTHSQGLALIALAKQRIGVDLEFARPLPDLSELAGQCLSQSEKSDLDALPSRDQLSHFYRFWTCKEACLKAQGVGLTRQPNAVRVALSADNARGSATVHEGGASETFFVRSFTPFIGHIAAIAFSRSDVNFKCFAI